MAARRYLPEALADRKKRYEEIQDILNENGPRLAEDNPERVLAQKTIHETLVRFYRLRESQVPEVLERGLFLALFSAFDAFTGDLLRALYTIKPDLFGALNRSISLSDVLSAPSIDALKLQVLDDDVETLRRQSYTEQFETLSKRFDVKLTAFERWPDFVECSQRRNLITHCDSIVTDQYLSVCRSVGLKETSLPKAGSRVRLGAKYFYAACELVLEVGVKLGQTLWRKTLPEELEKADSHLMDLLYETLEIRNWSRARVIGEFAFNQKKLSSDLNRKLIIVNYVQALKRDGAADEARKLVENVDWSAAVNDFKLARAVLLEEYGEAVELMRRIGPKSEMIDETSYHTWPLFIEFRDREDFAEAYAEIFGHPYATKLKEEADQASRRAGAAARSEPEESSALTNQRTGSETLPADSSETRLSSDADVVDTSMSRDESATDGVVTAARAETTEGAHALGQEPALD